jgi:phosphatidylethanolamine-binding protein (PEBP) family uncharacterized protein
MRGKVNFRTAVGGTCIALLAAAGCGGGSSASSSAITSSADITAASTAASTAQETAPATASQVIPPEISIDLTSPIKLKPISSHYTCDGANSSLPLAWRNVPANTVELVVFIFTLPGDVKHIPDWAVAGLRPSLHQLSTGRVPSGAIVGRNSEGANRYSICPHKGKRADYLVHLYALTHRVSATPGFDPNRLREMLQQHPTHEGLLEFSYARR